MVQGSVLNPLLFDTDIIDLFYTDDATPYGCGENIWTVISELQ